MSRSPVLLALAGALLLNLTGVSQAQRGRSVCPFLASLQMQQMQQMQRQIQQQQALVQRQQQAMPPSARNSGSRSSSPGSVSAPSRNTSNSSARPQSSRSGRPASSVQRPSTATASRSTTTTSRAWSNSGRFEPPGPGPGSLAWHNSGRSTQTQGRSSIQQAPRPQSSASNQNTGRQQQPVCRAESSGSRPTQTGGREVSKSQRSTTQPPRPAPQNSRVTRQVPQHSSRTQARMSMNFSCGQCHHGPEGQPGQVQQGNPKQPFQVGGPGPDMDKAVQKNNPQAQAGRPRQEEPPPWQRPVPAPRPDGLATPCLVPVSQVGGPGLGNQQRPAVIKSPTRTCHPFPWCSNRRRATGNRSSRSAGPGRFRGGVCSASARWHASQPKSQGQIAPTSPLQPSVSLGPTASSVAPARGSQPINPVLLEEAAAGAAQFVRRASANCLPSDVVQTPPPPPPEGRGGALRPRSLLPATAFQRSPQARPR